MEELRGRYIEDLEILRDSYGCRFSVIKTRRKCTLQVEEEKPRIHECDEWCSLLVLDCQRLALSTRGSGSPSPAEPRSSDGKMVCEKCIEYFKVCDRVSQITNTEKDEVKW